GVLVRRRAARDAHLPAPPRRRLDRLLLRVARRRLRRRPAARRQGEDAAFGPAVDLSVAGRVRALPHAAGELRARPRDRAAQPLDPLSADEPGREPARDPRAHRDVPVAAAGAGGPAPRARGPRRRTRGDRAPGAQLPALELLRLPPAGRVDAGADGLPLLDADAADAGVQRLSRVR